MHDFTDTFAPGDLAFWYAQEGRFKDMPTQIHKIVKAYVTPNPHYNNRVDTQMVYRWDGRAWNPIKNGQINTCLYAGSLQKVTKESVAQKTAPLNEAVRFYHRLLCFIPEVPEIVERYCTIGERIDKAESKR